MISPETRAEIRRYFYAEHWKIGTIARELNVHPDAVRKRRCARRSFRAVSLRRGVTGRVAPAESRGPPPQTAHLRQVGLLCIDEVGYLSFDDKAADLLYEVVNRRYERKPVILATNRPFKEWNEVFPNATCIVTLLDRLLHHADCTVIEGNSYRVCESEQETSARRRKK